MGPTPVLKMKFVTYGKTLGIQPPNSVSLGACDLNHLRAPNAHRKHSAPATWADRSRQPVRPMSSNIGRKKAARYTIAAPVSTPQAGPANWNIRANGSPNAKPKFPDVRTHTKYPASPEPKRKEER